MFITTHLVKNFDIGLNNNLYGGRMLDWLDEAGALFTKELFPNQNFVTLKIAETIFHYPVHANDVIKFFISEPSSGRTSLSFNINVKRGDNIVLTTNMVFVCIDENGVKMPYNTYSLDKEIFTELMFNRVKNLYNNNNSYHNIDHVKNLLNQIKELNLSKTEYNILCSAICYHDCVYNPKNKTGENEEQSCEIMDVNVAPSAEKDIAEFIIIDTAYFYPKFEKYLFSKSHEESLMIEKLRNIMHDIDYSYFINYDDLCVSDDKIREEYTTFISNEDFNNGRKNFLIDLSKKDIYRGIYLKHNNTAKENIVKLIKERYKG